MTDHAASPSTALFSRRSLLLSLALAPIPALLSCRSIGTPADASSAELADAQVDRVMAGHNALARSAPDLPGIRSLAQLNERLVEGFSPADLALLTAALSLRARELAVRIPRPVTMTDVRSVLSRPIDMAPYGRSFFERTLAEARAREATDPAYGQQLQRHRRRCSCLWGTTACWMCIAMAIIIILAIILALVL